MSEEKNARPGPAEDAGKPQVRAIDLRELLADAREIVLIHAGERYRLRITGNNKLILTK